jgi:putative transcriptional regulator
MASQSVFARHLGVSVSLISQWERGEKKPQGASLKLLTLVKKNGLAFVA